MHFKMIKHNIDFVRILFQIQFLQEWRTRCPTNQGANLLSSSLLVWRQHLLMVTWSIS